MACEILAFFASGPSRPTRQTRGTPRIFIRRQEVISVPPLQNIGRQGVFLAIAAFAVLLTFGWQAATVHSNYGGDWSALFFIGDRWPLPPPLAGEAYVHPNNPGYDGVFYHLVAHDPWFSRGFSHFADNASLRWRRILTPALAHLASAGADGRTHSAYLAINLLFVFLGTYWLASYGSARGFNPACGLAFLAIPSVLVSMDRLTIDTALAALTVGFMLFASTSRPVATLVVLALCPLARETGLALTAGHAWLNLRDHKLKLCLYTLLSAVPFVLWAVFVSAHTSRDGTPWLSFPFLGIVRRTLHPLQYPITSRWVALAAAFDYLALLGVWIAMALVARQVVRRSFDLTTFCLLFFSLGALCLGKEDIWAGAYEFGRTMSPLLILLGLLAIRERKPYYLLPLVCVLPRIFLQLEPQMRGILRH